MYTEYFGLKEKPFRLTPDTKYLYLSKNHNRAFISIVELLYTVKEKVGFATLIGEVGTGKTTVCRAFVNHIQQLKDKFQIALILNPSFDEVSLYRNVLRELGLELNGESKEELHNLLASHLLKVREEGKTAILVIDEAQNLTPQVLEQIRLLSNLETETEKLI